MKSIILDHVPPTFPYFIVHNAFMLVYYIWNDENKHSNEIFGLTCLTASPYCWLVSFKHVFRYKPRLNARKHTKIPRKNNGLQVCTRWGSDLLLNWIVLMGIFSLLRRYYYNNNFLSVNLPNKIFVFTFRQPPNKNQEAMGMAKWIKIIFEPKNMEIESTICKCKSCNL